MLAKAALASTLAVVLVPLGHAQSNSATPTGVSADDWSSIRAAYEAGRHAIVATDDGLRARTPGQAWTTEFDTRAFTTTPDGGGWSWGLELTHFGAADALEATSAPLAITVDGQRLERRWAASLTEWYVNDTRGLEHGFTVHAAPSAAPSDVLAFDLAVRGDLTPRISSSGRDIAFLADSGHLVLNYAGLVAFDADGDHLAAHFESRGASLRLVVDARGAEYPLTIDPIAQQVYMKASNTGADDAFGFSVAVHGNTIVVGAPREASNATGVNGNGSNNSKSQAGAAYVFVRSGTVWTQQAYLKASNTDATDAFGTSVAIHRDTIVVGAEGEDSSANVVNGDQADNSASLAGAAYVFVRTGTTWSQQAYLKSSNGEAEDRFGSSVAISGESIVVGARGESSIASGVNGNQLDNSAVGAGAAYVFTRTGTAWSQQAYLKASNTGVLFGSISWAYFGTSVAISGNTLIVGAPGESNSATGVNQPPVFGALESGAAYVFVRSGGVWSQEAHLKASNTGSGDEFGDSVAISNDIVIVGALGEESAATGVNGDPSDDSASNSGAAYVFTRNGSTWSQEAYLKASNTDASDNFGESVAISGGWAVVGAPDERSSASGVDGDSTDDSAADAGAAYVFLRTGTTWTQQGYLKASNTDSLDFFGYSVALDGNRVVVGATGESSNATGVNGDPIDDSAAKAGAAYVFDLDFFELVPGCLVNPATFVEPSGATRIGTTTNIELLGGTLTDGFVATYYGAKSVDLAGCGLLLSPTEELLLALSPFPALLGYGVMSGGMATVPVTLPNNLAFVGLEVTLQAAIVDTNTFASELSNAIEFEIRP
jgi:hypothetical protein